jgi:CBS domain-containing protein
MTEKKVHHIPVLKGDKLVGMIEQHDVIKGIAVEGSDKGA